MHLMRNESYPHSHQYRIILMHDTELRIASCYIDAMRIFNVSHQYPHQYHENADAASASSEP